jgi:hypothetical protein
MDVSTLGNIILGTYGALLTTYTIVNGNKAKKRRLSVNVSTGFRPVFRDGNLGPQLLLITVTNPGSRKVTVDVPYLELPDGKNLVTPMPLTNVSFPYRLEEGENCVIWIEMNEVKDALLKKGYSGTVRLRGKVSDATGRVFKSKKSWDFELGKPYD